jgi:hypothetical protein
MQQSNIKPHNAKFHNSRRHRQCITCKGSQSGMGFWYERVKAIKLPTIPFFSGLM